MRFVVSCEHASNFVPAEVALGVAAEVLDSHVAWDAAALPVAREVARSLGVRLHAGEQTRLVADLNRSPENPAAIPDVAFGVPVPGNTGLTAAARAERLARYHTPYWSRVRADVMEALASGGCLHLFVHSFSPGYGSEPRDFDLGLLYHPERPAEVKVAAALEQVYAAARFDVRHNQPYNGYSDGLNTNFRNCMPPAYLPMEIEINERLLRTPEALGRVAAVTATALLAFQAR